MTAFVPAMEQQAQILAFEVLRQALDQPEAERLAFAHEACDGDPSLLSDVSSLLRCHSRAGEFLISPTAGGPGSAAAELARPPNAEGPGTVIGRYTLVRLIGEGGFGSVYLAHQDRPVRRDVALKILKLGMDTRQVIARFQAEQQALAMLDHPNVAKVLDAGATDTGRPYFVMELVRDGIPITRYCDEHELSIRQRLEYFITVCDAVQHAHGKGIIHRDLKPSNILAAEVDGKPVLKVIDFGIAKAVQGRLTDQSLVTEQRQLVGTPQYMSPEQIDGGFDVDTRSDVYSLGVVLYELLVGTTPFGLRDGGSPTESRWIVPRAEAPKPSSRLGVASRASPRLGTDVPRLESIAHSRGGCQLPRLRREIRRDLDWIALKAIEKDRNRRYETPSALAADLRRHLDNEPVTARPPSARYRFGKFVRRHRVGVVAGTAVGVAILIGVVGLYVGLRRATAESNRAQALNKFMTGIFNRAQPGAGGNLRVVELLRLASKDVDATLRDQPEAQIDARETLGETFYRLGLGPEAQSEFERAHALSSTLDRGHPSARTLRAAHWLAICVDDLSPPGDLRCIAMARQTYLEAVRVLGESHPVARVATASYARLLVLHDQPVEAEPILRKLLAQPPTDPANDLIPNGVMVSNLVLALVKQGRIGTEAADLERGNIKSLRAELGSGSRSGSLSLVNAQMYLAFILAHQGKQGEAMECLREAMVDAGRMFGSLHGMTQWTTGAYAYALSRTGQFEAARDLLDENLRLVLAEQSGDSEARAEALIERGLLHVRRRENGGMKFILDGVAMEQRVRKDVQPWDAEALRFAVLGALGSWRHASDGGLAAQLYCAVDEILRANPVRLIELAGESPPAVRYQLCCATSEVVSEGALEDLPAALDAAPGLYRLTIEATAAGSGSASPRSPPLQGTQWLLVAPWKVSVYYDEPAVGILRGDVRFENPAIEGRDWAQRLGGGTPIQTRTAKSLAVMPALESSPAPDRREEDFGIVAKSTIDLPAGDYRIVVTSDDGVRLYVDGRQLINAWTVHGPQRHSEELSGGRHEVKVEYFQGGGGYKLWVRVEPVE